MRADPGETVRVEFTLTNHDTTRLTDIEVGINVFDLPDITLASEADSVDDGEWRVFESLTLWEPTEPITPGDTVRVVAPLSISSGARGVYQLRARARAGRGTGARASVRIEVPPIPAGVGLEFDVRAGAFRPADPFSLELVVADRPVCPDGRAALGYAVRAAGATPSRDTAVEIDVPEGWEVDVGLTIGGWDAEDGQVPLGTVDIGDQTQGVVVLKPASDIPETAAYEVTYRLVNARGAAAERTTQFTVKPERPCF